MIQVQEMLIADQDTVRVEYNPKRNTLKLDVDDDTTYSVGINASPEKWVMIILMLTDMLHTEQLKLVLEKLSNDYNKEH